MDKMEVQNKERGKNMTYNFKVNIGDWSDDGHGKWEKFFLESSHEVKEVQEAFKKTVETNTWLKRWEGNSHDIYFLDDYGDYTISKETGRKLNGIGIDLKGYGNVIDYSDLESEGIYYVTTRGLVMILMDIASLSLENFEYKVIEDIPNFNGFWGNLNEQFGYGLFE